MLISVLVMGGPVLVSLGVIWFLLWSAPTRDPGEDRVQPPTRKS